MTSHAIWVDEIVDVTISIKKINKSCNIFKNSFLNKFNIIFHFLSLCVFISIQNIGQNIPWTLRQIKIWIKGSTSVTFLGNIWSRLKFIEDTKRTRLTIHYSNNKDFFYIFSTTGDISKTLGISITLMSLTYSRCNTELSQVEYFHGCLSSHPGFH